MDKYRKYAVLMGHAADLVNVIAEDVHVYAGKFRDEELITTSIYNKVTDTKTMQDNTARARCIVKYVAERQRISSRLVLNKVAKILKELNQNNLADKFDYHYRHGYSMSVSIGDSGYIGFLPQKNQPVTDFLLCNTHIPLLIKKLHDIAYKWEEIGTALKIPLHMITNAGRSSADIIRLYNILEIFINCGDYFMLPPTLTNLNKCLSSPLVNATEHQVNEEDLNFISQVRQSDNSIKYRRAYEEILKTEKQVLKVLFAKLIFLGPPERGKTLTRLRLEKKMLNIESDPKYQNNPSTLLAKNNTYLITDLSETTALLSEKGWKALKEKTEEVHLLYQLFFKLKEDMQMQKHSSNKSLSGLLTHTSDPKIYPLNEKAYNTSADLSTEETSLSSDSITQVLDIFDESLASGSWEEIAGQLETLCLLYMKDTGGQPELMDMLPALIIGPALYLLFCRYGDNLDDTYKILLRGRETSSSIPDRMSTCTVRQNLTSALSSIFSMQSYSTVQASDNCLLGSLLKNSPKSVAYFVGTHKDKVSSQEMVAFDKSLQEAVKNTIFIQKELVHYVSKDGFQSNDPKDKMPEGMERLIYPIDNHHGTTEEIEGLQNFIHKALNKFPRPEIPARWLPFSLLLRFTRERYVDLGTCYRYGQKFRMDEAETDVALWFFHQFTGIIYYFPDVPELNKFVITDTQLVFDIISSLIFEIGLDFRQGAGDTLRRVGQISFEDIRKVSGDLFPPYQMKALLEHIHVITPLQKSLTEELFINEVPSQLYFMPCVLSNYSKEELHRNIQKVSNSSYEVYNLKISFISGFVPIGLFPSAIASLVGQASEQNLLFPFELMDEQNIKKNFITFSYGRDGDTVVFVAHPSYYEIIVARPTSCRIPAFLICNEIREIVENTLDNITENTGTILNTYNLKTVSRRYQIAFDCPHHSEEGHLCTVKKGDKDPYIMWCKASNGVRTRIEMADEQLVWFGKVKESHQDLSVKEFSGHDNKVTGPQSKRMKLQHYQDPEKVSVKEILQKVDSSILKPDDLSIIIEDLGGKVTAVWDHVALSLGLKQWDIDRISRDCFHQSSQCLQQALYEWLCIDRTASWKKLAETIKDFDSVLFDEIAEKHRTCAPN